MHESEFAISLAIEFIIGLIILIAFFNLCINVSAIKRKYAPKGDKFAPKFHLLMIFGKKQEAQQLIIDQICNDIFNCGYQITPQLLDAEIKKYQDKIEACGMTIDQDYLLSLLKQD